MTLHRNRLDHLYTGWAPPAGLSQSRPRNVTYTGQGRILISLSTLFLIGAGAWIAILAPIAHRQAVEASLLQREGKVVPGWITRLWRGKGDSRQPYAAYEYEVAGTKYEGRAKVKLSAWRNLQLGGEWPIRYLPSDPRLHHPESVPPQPMPKPVPYILAAIFLAGGLIMLRIVLRERSLLAEGRVAPGVILKMREHKSTVIVNYEFPIRKGAVQTGKSRVKQVRPGPAAVLYMQDDPGRNALYPMLLVKTRD